MAADSNPLTMELKEEARSGGSVLKEPSGSIGLVLLLALALIAVAGGFLFIGRANAEPYILVVLAALATIGVFLLFALAAGVLRVPAWEAASPLLRTVVEGANDGILVTDWNGRVLYANPSYRDLIGASDRDDIRPVERVFMGDPGVSESVYRLLKAAREGRRAQEEVRVGCEYGFDRSARGNGNLAWPFGRSRT